MLIGEVSRRTGVSTRMLRYYDSHGLVTPSHRTSGGYREYSRDDLGRLMKVESLRSLGMGVEEVRTALDDPALDVAAVVDRLREETRERIRDEQTLLAQLDSLRDHHDDPPDSWDDVLTVTSLLSALRSRHSGTRQAAVLRTAPGRATTALATSYLDEADPNVAGTLRWSLARAGENAVPALTARMTSADAAARLRIVEALGDIAGDTSTAALKILADDKDCSVRSRAVLSLAPGRPTTLSPGAWCPWLSAVTTTSTPLRHWRPCAADTRTRRKRSSHNSRRPVPPHRRTPDCALSRLSPNSSAPPEQSP